MSFPQRGAGDRGAASGPGNLKINYRIRAKQVRVIDPEGQQLGVLALPDAIRKAEEAGLDLVEISPMSTPPVCRIMDYGKFKYDTKKRAQESRRHQTVVEIKEVKMRPKTDEHDLDFKIKHIQRFLEEGNKVKVTVMFRGREITHAEIGRDLLRDVAEKVKAQGQIEVVPKIEGKSMFMILSAARKGGGAPRPQPSAASSASPAGAAPATAPRPAPAAVAARPAGPEIEVKRRPPAAGIDSREQKGT